MTDVVEFGKDALGIGNSEKMRKHEAYMADQQAAERQAAYDATFNKAKGPTLAPINFGGFGTTTRKRPPTLLTSGMGDTTEIPSRKKTLLGQ